MTKKLKLCMTTNCIHVDLLDEEPRRSGLYQWLDVFPNSEMNVYNRHRDYEKYDVVLVNAAMGDTNLIPAVVESLENSDTKVVVGNDYAVEMWQGYFMQHPWELARSLGGADYYFATEWASANGLQALLPDEKIHCIPHPANPKLLGETKKRLFKEIKSENERVGVDGVDIEKDIVSVLYHRYDNQTVNPWIVVKDCGWYTSLLGYIHGDNADKKNWITTTLFDKLVAYGSHEDHIKALIQSKIVYEPSTLHTWGRSIVEAAALGLPVVGSNRNAALAHLYPETAFDPYDLYNQRRVLHKLIDNVGFREHVAEKALGAVGYYDFNHARKRFLGMLEDGV